MDGGARGPSARQHRAWSAQGGSSAHRAHRRRASRLAVFVALFFTLRGPLAERADRRGAAEGRTTPQACFSWPTAPAFRLVRPMRACNPWRCPARGVTLKLEAGAAKFSVTPDPTRPFRVLARNVTVTVLGTVFDVAFEGTGVRVSVERGRVRVDSGSASRELAPGQSALFADGLAAPAVPPAVTAPVAPTPPVAASGPSWRVLAQDGDYSAALARLTTDGPAAVRDTPDDLLLAADVARLGGQPVRAVPPLERVVSRARRRLACTARRLHARAHAARPARSAARSGQCFRLGAQARARGSARPRCARPRGRELVARRRDQESPCARTRVLEALSPRPSRRVRSPSGRHRGIERLSQPCE